MVYWGVVVFVTSFFTACGGDNSYDGKNGLAGGAEISGKTGDALSSIKQNILEKHADGFVEELNGLKVTLETFDSNLTTNDITKLQNSFVAIMKEWKALQSTYIAGGYESSMIDVPRFIEYFIKKSKNQDISADVEKALGQTIKIEHALFKNTSLSMNALEFLLFGRQDSTNKLVIEMNRDTFRRISALKLVIKNLITRGSIISEYYRNDTAFESDSTLALDSLVNQMVQSAFDLREKRIGEPAGLVAKTKDNPDATQLEYYNSKNSLLAVKTILEAHQEMMGKQSFENLGTFAEANGANKIVTDIRANISNALALVAKLSLLEESISSTSVDTNIEKLYDEIKELEDNYHTSLINSLNVTAKIIDADGD